MKNNVFKFKNKTNPITDAELKAELKEWDVTFLEQTNPKDKPKFVKEKIALLPTIDIMRDGRAERMTGFKSKAALLKRLRAK
jgi:hypothetical protein